VRSSLEPLAGRRLSQDAAKRPGTDDLYQRPLELSFHWRRGPSPTTLELCGQDAVKRPGTNGLAPTAPGTFFPLETSAAIGDSGAGGQCLSRFIAPACPELSFRWKGCGPCSAWQPPEEDVRGGCGLLSLDVRDEDGVLWQEGAGYGVLYPRNFSLMETWYGRPRNSAGREMRAEIVAEPPSKLRAEREERCGRTVRGREMRAVQKVDSRTDGTGKKDAGPGTSRWKERCG
jgi:hypothetical protein